jgi:hypothetical protein
MIEPYHPSFLEKLVTFFVRDPKVNVAFQDEFEEHRVTGYEFEMSLTGFQTQPNPNLHFQEVSIRQPGSDASFLLAEDIYRKYGISINSLRRLCKEQIIFCEKRSGRWFVSEYSVLDYLDKVEGKW